MGFRVKYETKEQFINGLKSLKEIGALGDEIGIGTSLYDSVNLDNIINGESNFYVEKPCYDDDVMEFSIGVESESKIKSFPHLFGKNGLYVSLTTYYDCVVNKDVYKTTVPYDKMIEETLKLMNKNEK